MLKEKLGEEQIAGLIFCLFDMMHLNSFDVTGCRQTRAQGALSQMRASPPPFIKYSEHYEGLPERVRKNACAMHLQGVICKRADAPYKADRNKIG